jgi:transcriptional regulator with XRE-family HTH domain
VYEDTHVPYSDSSASEILRTLMEEHALKQSDLSEIGSQGVVSEILSGKRDLNVRQITQLAARFGVSPALFMPVPKKPGKRPSLTGRDAKTGQFLPVEEARSRPSTTVVERVALPGKGGK